LHPEIDYIPIPQRDTADTRFSGNRKNRKKPENFNQDLIVGSAEIVMQYPLYEGSDFQLNLHHLRTACIYQKEKKYISLPIFIWVSPTTPPA
jgi:hypothetical protein